MEKSLTFNLSRFVEFCFAVHAEFPHIDANTIVKFAEDVGMDNAEFYRQYTTHTGFFSSKKAVHDIYTESLEKVLMFSDMKLKMLWNDYVLGCNEPSMRNKYIYNANESLDLSFLSERFKNLCEKWYEYDNDIVEYTAYRLFNPSNNTFHPILLRSHIKENWDKMLKHILKNPSDYLEVYEKCIYPSIKDVD